MTEIRSNRAKMRVRDILDDAGTGLRHNWGTLKYPLYTFKECKEPY